MRFTIFSALVTGLLAQARTSGNVCPSMERFRIPSQPMLDQAKKMQLRLAWGNQPDSMLITWNSLNTTTPGAVHARVCSDEGNSAMSTFSGTTAAIEQCYTFGSHVHSVEVNGLSSDTQYYYSIRVEPDDWSGWMPFRTAKSERHSNYTFAVVGDLGVIYGGPVTRALTRAVDAGDIEMVVHNGDISYADMEIKSNNGTTYQDFLDYHYENTSAFASRVPYMLMPGNHEPPCDYLEFRRRAVRPAMQRGDYYSYTQGSTRFIMLSAERGQLSGKADDPETTWLQAELRLALALKRNGSIDWIFTFVHYPTQPFGYCTYNLPFCSAPVDATQEWFEDLFASHEVDIHFTAHQHVYERTFPVYRQRPVFPNSSVLTPHSQEFPGGNHSFFDDPPYPMHLVNGAAGDDVVFAQNWLQPPAWSVINSRTVQFGFTSVKVSPKRVDISYRVPLEATPGSEKVFTVDEFSIVKTESGQLRKRALLDKIIPDMAPQPSMMWV